MVIDGNLLDEGSLYYEILVDEEPLKFTLYFDDEEELESTRVPYAYTDFYDIWVEGEDHTVYVYTGSDKEYRVRIVYINEKGETLYSAAVGGGSDGVAGIAADEIESEVWYDMQGRRVVKPASGMAIRVATLKDGRIVRNKLIMK